MVVKSKQELQLTWTKCLILKVTWIIEIKTTKRSTLKFAAFTVDILSFAFAFASYSMATRKVKYMFACSNAIQQRLAKVSQKSYAHGISSFK